MPVVLPPRGDDAILHRAFLDSGPLLSLAPAVKRLRVTAPLVGAPAPEGKRACRSMDALPDECLLEILRRVGDGRDRSAAACVSRRWLMLLGSVARSGKNAGAATLPDLNEDPGGDEQHQSPEIERCLDGKDANDAKLAAVAVGSGGGIAKLSVRSGSDALCSVTDVGLRVVARSCGSLRTLVIWDAPFVGDDGLLEIAGGCPLLETLDLCHCPSISDVGIAAIAERCPNLTSLSVESCPKIGDKALQAIGQLCSKLRSVSISCCPAVSDRGVSSLVAAASASLRKLALQSLSVSDAALGAVGYYGEEITELVLGDLANAGGRGFWVMGSACGLQKLQSLVVSSCDGLTDLALEAITKACPLLRRLELRRSPCLTSAGLKALSRVASSLESLRLDECGKITMDGLVATLLNCQDKLRVLSVSKCASIAACSPASRFPAVPCGGLRSLAVRNCPEFGDAGVAILTRFCPKLQQLDLRGHSGITNGGLLELIRRGEGLVKVNLNGCSGVTDAAVSALAKLHGKTLEALSLEGCRRITDESLATIASSCCMLKSLDVSFSAISDVGVLALSSASQLNLSVLSLAHCARISNRSLESLAGLGRPLIGLNLQNCAMISPSSILSLEERMWWCDILF